MPHRLRKISFLLLKFWLKPIECISTSNFKKLDAFTSVIRIFVLNTLTHNYIGTPNEMEFMNAFVGEILAICKCKKKNDKFMLV